MDWTAVNCLQLNDNKLKVLVIAPDDAVPVIKQSIGHLSSAVHLKVRNLWVIFDKSLLFEHHVKQLSRDHASST